MEETKEKEDTVLVVEEVKSMERKEIPKEVQVVKEKSEKPIVKEVIPIKKEEDVVTKTVEKQAKEAVNILFKVQIMASSKDMPLRSEDFKGLNKLSKEPYKNLYRYMYGSTDSYFQATLLKSNADAKGYTTSYIVAYKNGKRILMEEARKYVSE